MKNPTWHESRCGEFTEQPYTWKQSPMTISKKTLIIGCMVTWLMIIVIFMFLAGSFDIEVLFVLWLIGILIIAELIDARYVRPGYVRMIMIIAGAGTVLFGIIVLRKVWVILYG